MCVFFFSPHYTHDLRTSDVMNSPLQAKRAVEAEVGFVVIVVVGLSGVGDLVVTSCGSEPGGVHAAVRLGSED